MTNLADLQTKVVIEMVVHDESLGLQTEVIFGAAEHDNRL